MNVLPTEILSLIFSFLTELEDLLEIGRVSRRWAAALALSPVSLNFVRLSLKTVPADAAASNSAFAAAAAALGKRFRAASIVRVRYLMRDVFWPAHLLAVIRTNCNVLCLEDCQMVRDEHIKDLALSLGTAAADQQLAGHNRANPLRLILTRCFSLTLFASAQVDPVFSQLLLFLDAFALTHSSILSLRPVRARYICLSNSTFLPTFAETSAAQPLFPFARVLFLGGCVGLTGERLTKFIRKNCPVLRALELSFFNERDVETLRIDLPELSIFRFDRVHIPSAIEFLSHFEAHLNDPHEALSLRSALSAALNCSTGENAGRDSPLHLQCNFSMRREPQDEDDHTPDFALPPPESATQNQPVDDQSENSVVRWLLRHGALINTKDRHGNTAAILAARTNNTSALRTLLAFKGEGGERANLRIKNASGQQTALYLAAIRNRQTAFELLLRHDATLLYESGPSWNALQIAVIGGHLGIIELILRSHPDMAMLVNQYRQTALHLAVRYPRLNVIELLLRAAPLAVHKEDEDGNRPVDYAFIQNNAEAVALLLAHNPSTTPRTNLRTHKAATVTRGRGRGSGRPVWRGRNPA
eukprot:TRINITY_DN5923_c0_g1_i1.p1 TRINITY_DN5923_c0_g1~~TRINITY_DN5923_c0_g1_i1.p1  ORF type:complete len:602 (-),score=127.70 TRINITY_DN5923_c0_g1_i1:32-1792(-)